MVGCEIDGVINYGFLPDGDYVIVSARPISEWDKTISELGTSIPIYLRPFGTDGSIQDAAHWKIQMINSVKLSAFYESDVEQATIIKRKCPWCDVILVREKK